MTASSEIDGDGNGDGNGIVGLGEPDEHIRLVGLELYQDFKFHQDLELGLELEMEMEMEVAQSFVQVCNSSQWNPMPFH